MTELSSQVHMTFTDSTRSRWQNTTNFPVGFPSTSVSFTSKDGTAAWFPVGITGVLLVSTWLANCILLGGALQTAGSGRIVPVAYFFVGSQAIAALLHVTINLPPAAVNILFGASNTQSYVHIFCLYSTYLDTLFCNLTFLQTFFSSLDAFLRLKNPVFYVASAKRRPALWLKIGSPWLVAGIQAIGQLALSDRQQVRLHTVSTVEFGGSSMGSSLQSTCLLPDPNFLIIRTAIAYALPLITCLLLVGLQLRSLRRLRNYSEDALNALLQVRHSYGHPYPVRSVARHTGGRTHGIPLGSQSNTFYKMNGGTGACFTSSLYRSPSEHISLIPVKLPIDQPDKQRLLKSMQGSWNINTQQSAQSTSSDELNRLIRVITQTDASKLGTQSQAIPQVLLSSHAVPLVELRSVSPTPPCFSSMDENSIFHCPTHGIINVSNVQQDLKEDNPTEGTMVTYNKTDDRKSSETCEHVQSAGGELKPPSLLDHKALLDQSVGCSLATSSPMVSSISMNSIGHTISTDLLIALPSKQTPLSENADTIQLNPDEKRQNATTGIPRWLTAYYGEQLVVAINLVSCIIAVGTWSPYILATLAHGLCQPIQVSPPFIPTTSGFPFTPKMDASLLNKHHTKLMDRCLIQVGPDRIADFKWWAYASSGLLLPCLLFFLDLGLREGCWKALYYGGTSKQTEANRSEKTSPITTNTPTQVETYRCSDFKKNSSGFEINENNTSNPSSVINPPWSKRETNKFET
ncbi:hypothetical protein CRM22_003026 [Opisthorchis felineus]|uniref:G-protein coupled receptors family 1 profile domain-containing protein n=1 Tax=Opisthorchis felineus TaxID=147828 RepID=A0A4S2M376_OPIFE|nr:hypothetical protein CRM22_003026 [Opisthorchis felineus]